MKYRDFKEEDFAEDAYFQRWVQHPDEENRRFWNQFISDYPQREEVIDRARLLVRYLSDGTESSSSKDEMWKEISQKISSAEYGEAKKLTKHNYNKKLLTAVTAACLLGISVLIVHNMGLLNNKADLKSPQITLKLQDGSEQIIDESDTRTISTREGRALGSQNQHVLVYDSTNNARELVYNELTVPYGKKFELVLSDGSHIHLNAGSHLRYPVQFLPGQPRDVFLDGEAFFEVAKDDRPFTVMTQQMNTRVYGTRFNVTSYKNEGNTYTVLEEGSVGVYRPEKDEGEALKIVPGQRAVMENGSIAVEEVRVEKYVAWTRGELYFKNDPFALILKKLERHFNVKIENRYSKLNPMEFTATFKDETLEIGEVLDVYRVHTPFRYTIEGNTVIISPP